MVCAVTELRRANSAPARPGSASIVYSVARWAKDSSMRPRRRPSSTA